MSRRDDTAAPSWDELVAGEPLIGSEGTVGGLDLPPVDAARVDRLLAQVPDDEHHRGSGAAVRLRHAVQLELTPRPAQDQPRVEAALARDEVAVDQQAGQAPSLGARPGASSVLVLVVLMLSAWLPTLGAMREGFDGVAWTWAVVTGLLVSLGCAALLATPRLMARPVAPDWQRGTGFGLVAVASTVLLGSVLFRLYGGSTIADDTIPQFVLLVAVPVVAVAAWLLLRDRPAGPQREAAARQREARDATRDVTDATIAVHTAQVEELELRLDQAIEQLTGQVSEHDARAALALELAGLRRLYETGRLTPDSAGTAAAEAARYWQAG